MPRRCTDRCCRLLMQALELRCACHPLLHCAHLEFCISTRLTAASSALSSDPGRNEPDAKTIEEAPTGLRQALASKRISFFSLCPAFISLMRGIVLFIVNVVSHYL